MYYSVYLWFCDWLRFIMGGLFAKKFDLMMGTDQFHFGSLLQSPLDDEKLFVWRRMGWREVGEDTGVFVFRYRVFLVGKPGPSYIDYILAQAKINYNIKVRDDKKYVAAMDRDRTSADEFDDSRVDEWLNHGRNKYNEDGKDTTQH